MTRSRLPVSPARNPRANPGLHRIGRRWSIALAMVFLLGACASRPPIERIAGIPPIDRSQVASVPLEAFESGEFVARDGMRLRYRLLPPQDPQPGQRYPLVLQLHGSGGIGDDNQRQMETMAKAWALPDVRSRYPAWVLVPQFPIRSANYDDPKVPRSAQASPALAAALELVDHVVAARAVDRQRIYATGFSMGGSAAWLAPLLRPDLFAAAVPVAGIAPPSDQGQPLIALPLLVLHGDADTENPIDSDRRMVAHLHALGGKQVRLREYAGLAHMPPADQLPGTWWRDWLFAQRRDAR